MREMLKLVKTMKELPLPQLMALYEESNRRMGAQRYPREPEPRQLQLAEEDFRQYLSQVFFPTSGAVYALWLVGEKPLSALRLEPYRDGMLLEGLETAPHARGHGYATALLRQVQAQLPEKILYSHVDKHNAPSLAVHKKVAFQILSHSATYIDGSVSTHALTLRWEKP